MNIAEVCKKFDTPPATLRYYESVGLIPPVKRTKGGIRDYDEADILRLEFIVCMRGAGIPVDELARYVRLFKKGDEALAERKNILIEQRSLILSKIKELQEAADKLDYKIDNYEGAFLEKEKEMLGKTVN